MQPVILVIMLTATHTAAPISNSCNGIQRRGLHVPAAQHSLPTDIWSCHSGAANSVLAIQVLLSCTGCAVATWLSLRWDRSQAYADWSCVHQLHHLCIRPQCMHTNLHEMSHRLQHIPRSCSAGILLVTVT